MYDADEDIVFRQEIQISETGKPETGLGNPRNNRCEEGSEGSEPPISGFLAVVRPVGKETP